MSRLNMTLDADTESALDRYARRHKKPRATVARELLREGIIRREAIERRHKLAQDYALGKADAHEVLMDLSDAQLELLDDREEA